MPAVNLFNEYGKGQNDHVAGGYPVDLDTDTIKVALITSAVAPNLDTHTHWSDLSANEVSGTGYTAGGETLAGKTVTRSAAVTTFDCADITWAQNGAGFSNARHAIFYKDTGTPATSPLIATSDFGADKGNVTNQLVLQIDAAGLLTFTVNA